MLFAYPLRFSFSFFSRPIELSEVDGASGKLFRYSSPKLGQILQSFIHIPSKYLLFFFMFILRSNVLLFFPSHVKNGRSPLDLIPSKLS